MRKKIIGDSSGLLSFPCIGLIIMAITSAVLATDPAQIESAKQNIISLIQTANTTQADAEVQKLIADEPNSPAKGQALQQIAAAYKDNKQYDEAIELSQYVIANWPDEEFAMWSQMHVAWSYIIMNNNTAGQAETDKLIAQYRNKPDLPWAVCIIAELHQWFNRYKEATNLYQWVVEHYPASSWEEKAKLGLARINVLSLVATGHRDAAWTAFDKLLADFGGHPDMNETARAVSDKFKWQEQYNDAKLVLTKVAQGTPAEILPKVNIVVRKNEILSLIQSGKDAEVQAAIEKFTIDYSSDPNLPEALYWFARTYEWSDKYSQARLYYEQLAMRYPSSQYANIAPLDIAKGQILVLLGASDNPRLLKMVDQLIVDHPEDNYLWEAADRLTGGNNAELIEQSKQLGTTSKEYLEKAVAVWLEVIEQLPQSPFAPWALHLAGDRYHYAIGDYARASEHYLKVVRQWPNYPFSAAAYLDLGKCYESLRSAGKLPDNEASLKIENTYRDIVVKYPESPQAVEAYLKLGWLKFGQNNLEEAVTWFNKAFEKFPVGRRPADALYLVARYYQQTEQTQKALEAYQELLASLPSSDPLAENARNKILQINQSNQ